MKTENMECIVQNETSLIMERLEKMIVLKRKRWFISIMKAIVLALTLVFFMESCKAQPIPPKFEKSETYWDN